MTWWSGTREYDPVDLGFHSLPVPGAVKFDTSVTDAQDVRIKYYFSPSQSEQRTFKLAYTVAGATRYYTITDVVYWSAVYAARNDARAD